MERVSIAPRPDWQAAVEELGLVHHSHWLDEEGKDVRPYWDESAYYRFTMAEVDAIDDATAALHQMCLEAVDHVVAKGRFAEFRIPPRFWGYIAETWRRRDPTLYGRMDLAYDGRTPPKLLEYNADTPTTAIETAVVQWQWLEQAVGAGKLPSGADQFNSMHEKLIRRFKEIGALMPASAKLHFAAMPLDEDVMTVEYLRDCANQAGLATAYVQMDHVGWDGSRFVDLGGDWIRHMFKLYPWEWMFTDDFGENVLRDGTGFLEPAWKCLLSNKAILPVLWELFPRHENLLPASFAPLGDAPQVRKPILGREGQNVTITGLGSAAEKGGSYGAEGHVYQLYAPLYQQGGTHAVIGSWVVGDETAGMCVRENGGPIIDNVSRFVPHAIAG